MQYAGTYRITNKEFSQLIRNEESRETVKRIFFNRSGDDWQFEHNNFQEFLAAQKVSEQCWNTIQKIVLLNNGKLKPKWLNAFSFLINLVEGNSELISYLIENDIDSLVKVEPNKVERSIRNEIFIKIFNRHKKEESVIWKNVYSENDLFNFGELETNDELIRFLLAEIEPTDSIAEVISNAVLILSHLKHPDKYIEEIKPLYICILTRKKIHRYGISRVILDSFTKWEIFDEQTKSALIDCPNLFEKDAPLSSLCRYLADGNFRDINAKLVLKFIDAFKEERVFGSEYALLEVLKLLSHEQLTELILLETPDDNKNRDRIWINDLYKLINAQAIETYHSDSKIDQAIIQFVYASIIYHDESYARQFKSFFEKTDLVEKSFKSCFLEDLKKTSDHRRELFVLPALIANHECLDWVIDLYSKGKINNDNVLRFLWALGDVGNQEGREYIEGPLNHMSNDYFKPAPNLWEIFNREKEELWFRVLLNQKLALEYIQKAFNTIKKSQITRREVIEIQVNREVKFKDVELIVGLELISHYSDDNIEKEEFVQRFLKKKYWDQLVTDEHSHRLNHQTLPKENLNWIQNWCDERRDKVILKGAITSLENNQYSYLLETNYFIRFVLYLNLKLYEDKLIEMISLIGFFEFNENINGISKQYKLYDHIKKYLPLNLIKNQIVKNLEEGGLPDIILAEHIRIVKEENLTEALSCLPKYILDPKVSRYVKQNLLDFYQSQDGDANQLVPVFGILDFKTLDNYFDWNVVNFMIGKKKSLVISFLKELSKTKECNPIKIGIYLIKAECEDGFSFLIEAFSSKYYSDDELLRDTITNLDLNVFNFTLISEFLVALLEKYISLNIGISGTRSLLPIVFYKFLELVSKTSIDDTILTSDINALLEKSANNETKKNARYHFNEFIEKVNQHKDKSFKIPDAIKKLKEIGICYEI